MAELLGLLLQALLVRGQDGKARLVVCTVWSALET